jgi:hypothetical protein
MIGIIQKTSDIVKVLSTGHCLGILPPARAGIMRMGELHVDRQASPFLDFRVFGRITMARPGHSEIPQGLYV